MGRGIILSDLSRPTQVRLEGHTLLWKRMVLGFHLAGNWECVEWARVQKGIYFPPHLHDRTEELYYLIAGDATFITDGVAQDAREGDIVLTKIGQSHALQVAPDRDVDILIVEVVPKGQPAGGKQPGGVLSLDEPHDAPERAESGALSVRSVDAGRILEGGWGRIERWELKANTSTKELTQHDGEVCFVVLGGSGTLHLENNETIPLSTGAVFVTPPDLPYRIAADAQGLQLVTVEVKLAAVPEAAG